MKNSNLKNSNYDPFIVVGTGKSGTSIVAKIMHDQLNIFMGSNFRGNFYEDLEFKENDDRFVKGERNFLGWQSKVEYLIHARRRLGKLWGLKNPRNAYIIGLYLRYFDNPKIIYCKRPEEMIINSCIKNYHWTREQTTILLRERRQALDRVLDKDKVLYLDFGERREDSWVKDKIINFFNLI